MKRIIAKIVTCIVVFILTVLISSRFMNQENIDSTEEMDPSSYPVVYMKSDGEWINCLHGYSNPMNGTVNRDSITPIDSDRNVEFRVSKSGLNIETIKVELRNVRDERLIESTAITPGFSEDFIEGKIELKDLIEANREYILIIVLSDGNKEVRYYTKIVNAQELDVHSKIEFVKSFHEATFDKEKAKSISPYLEPDDSWKGSYAHTNIHCNLNQITWGDLQVFEETDPDITIKEIGKNVAIFSVSTIVSMPGEIDKDYYTVTEYYRIRQTNERFYLLDYDRELNQIFRTDKNVVKEKVITMGICDDNIDLVETESGNIVAYVSNNRLYSYNSGDNSFISVFGYYSGTHLDKQALNNNHKVKILSMDEMGNIYFMVYGYINRGKREGRTGIAVYYYDYAMNSIEEQLFLPDNRSFEVLKSDVEQLNFLDSKRNLYLFLEQSIISINLESREGKVIVRNLKEGSFKVSDSNTMVAWKEGEKTESNPLTLMNLSTKRKTVIGENTGEIIIPFGFMQEDLVCGYATEFEANNDANSKIPMYKIVLVNGEGDVLMKYERDDVYVVDAIMQDNQITLERIDSSNRSRIPNDQIISSKIAKEMSSKVSLVPNGTRENIVEILLALGSSKGNVKNLVPKFVVSEYFDTDKPDTGEEDLLLYYVYGLKSIDGVYTKAYSAVAKGEELSAVVVDNRGNYVWKPGELLTKNQIMKFTAQSSSSERSSLAVCLDEILNFEGIQADSQSELNAGKTATEILEEKLNKKEVLNLQGCSLSSVLYYISNEKPVLALTTSGEAVLIVGYNEFNTVIMNPATGTLAKTGMQDSERFFAQFQNRFITYIDQ